MKIIDLVKFVLAVLLMGASIALAVFDPVNDDTDIFLANPNISAERPNVLIVLDNTANWNQPFTNEKNALVQVVNGLTDAFNVGLAMFPETGGGNDSVDGGYVRYHVRQMTLANKSALASMINNLDKITDKGNNATTGLALHETYLYYAGKTSIASHGKVKTDKDGTTDPLLSPLTGHALPAGTSPGLYRSPITDGCARNFVIYISNGPANENATARADLESKLGVLTGVSPPNVIGISPSGQQANFADEMAKFMANADVMATSAGIPNSAGVQNVYTYTVEVDAEAGANILTVTTTTAHGFAVNDPVAITGTTNFNGTYTVSTLLSTTKFTILATITPNPPTESAGDASGKTISEISQTSSDMTALLKSMAANGKGKYFGVSSSASGTAIVDALNAIFTEVQAVNSVFASTTLPVSVNVRGTNLNQVYIGVFRPDSNKSPRWLGNLKMYNLALNSATGAVYLADAANSPPPHASPPPTGNPAENTTTGFVSQNSPSFWTTSSSYWGFRDASQNGPGGLSDYPDGDLVEKGGAAQQLRISFAGAESATPTLRKLYTCTDGGLYTNQCPDAGTPLATPLANTPFTTANTDINAALLQLDTRFISPLSAYVTQPVTSISDRMPVKSLVNTWNTATSQQIFSISTSSTAAATITSLTTAAPKVVSALTGIVAGTISVPIVDISKSGSAYVVTTSAAFSGVVHGSTVLGIDCSGGASQTEFDSMTVTQRKVSASGTSGANFTYTIPGPSGNHTCTAGTATGPGPANSTTAQATLGAHGFVSGQQVTINGATPVQFNGQFNVTVIDADHFNYTMTSPAGASSGVITASGNTLTATATTSAPHGFANGSAVTVTGASIAGYNGLKVISCTPAPSCTGSTTFTYSVSPALDPVPSPSGVIAFQGGPTTATVTTYGVHGYSHNQLIHISGSDVPGYNGSFNISCPPNVNGLPCTTLTTFDITTATPLPADNSWIAFASATLSNFILVYAPNNPFSAGEPIEIEGGSATFNGSKVIAGTAGQYLFYYIDGAVAPTPITETTYTVRSRDNHRAYVTLPSHGYPNGQVLRIAGANPNGYNGEPLTIQVCVPTNAASSNFPCDPFVPGSPEQGAESYKNMFSYPLSAIQGANTSSAVTASIKGTLARATSVNHGFTNGSTVSIANATPSAFNGSKVVTVTGPDTFTYTIATPEGDATGTITAAQASGSSPERDFIIKWVRGEDNFQDENSNISTTDIRASVHGDVLHSRPAVINYNRFANSDDDVFVYYGGNDGVFHAVKGGYTVPTGDSSGLTPGQEAWGFVAQEFFGQFQRMRNNAPTISSAFKKPYFMDGPIGVLTQDNTVPPNGKLGDVINVPSATAQPVSDVVNLYIANRRGGRFLYALDVNAPTNPKFLWKISSGTAGFGELGQTWSQPTVVSNLSTVPVPVLVFGAGYDPDADDLDPATITAVDTTTGAITTAAGAIPRTMGRGIFVVNALTGELIWSAGNFAGATRNVPDMHYAIPSDVTVVRNQSGGAPSRAYVGDTGGNIWRIDFKQDTDATVLATSPNNLDLSTVTKIASVADQSTAAGRRKFLFPPDVVGQDGFDAILIGSGDREHPFDTTVTNRFYMFKDKGGDPTPVTGAVLCDPTITEGSQTADASCTPVTTIAGMTDLTSNCLQDATACLGGETQANVSTKLGTDRGWYITLLPGEKVVGNAISISGTTFFNTNQPSATAGGGTCGSNLGIARQYQVATADATATSDLNAVGGLTGADRSLIHAGGGYLPSPVHVVVMLGGKPVEAIISGIQVSTPAGTALSSRLRKYWYRELDVQ